MNFLTKQKDTHRLRTKLLVVAMGRMDGWGVWDGHVHTATFKMDDQQGPTVNTGNSAQC